MGLSEPRLDFISSGIGRFFKQSNLIILKKYLIQYCGCQTKIIERIVQLKSCLFHFWEERFVEGKFFRLNRVGDRNKGFKGGLLSSKSVLIHLNKDEKFLEQRLLRADSEQCSPHMGRLSLQSYCWGPSSPCLTGSSHPIGKHCFATGGIWK